MAVTFTLKVLKSKYTLIANVAKHSLASVAGQCIVPGFLLINGLAVRTLSTEFKVYIVFVFSKVFNF